MAAMNQHKAAVRWIMLHSETNEQERNDEAAVLLPSKIPGLRLWLLWKARVASKQETRK